MKHETTRNENGNPPPAKWATRQQLAARYNVHPRTVDEWRKAGNLPAFIYGRRIVRFDLEACDAWIDRLRHAARWEQNTGKARAAR
jgi:hypothetical protein